MPSPSNKPMSRPAATLLRAPAAAEFLGIAQSTLSKWRLAGTGPRFCKLGRSVAYDAADLAAFIEARKFSSTSEPIPSAA